MAFLFMLYNPNILNKINLSTLTTLTVVCACCAALFALALPIFFITGKVESIGNYGSFIGGLIGTVLSFVAVILVYQTYRLQEQELKETRDQLRKQQFETTFYNMLNMINTIGNQLSITINHTSELTRFTMKRINPEFKDDIQVHSGNNYCLQFIEEMRDGYNIDNQNARRDVFLARKIYALNPNDKRFDPQKFDEGELLNKSAAIMNLKQALQNWLSECENDRIYIGILYEYYFGKYEYQLGHFFRYISNTISFVLKHKSIQENNQESDQKNILEEREFYINLIQAQLSNYQLAVLFYNSLSSLSLDAKGEDTFRQRVDYYNLLKNLPKSLLIKREHTEYYPKTKFKNN